MVVEQGAMVNAFSFCLYGPPNPRYYTPLLENIKIAQEHFPDWAVWIYVAPDVDAGYIQLLESFPNVVLRRTERLGSPNTLERFFTIDEPGIDLMVVRDADSLVHWRDRWAIHQFLDRPQYKAHAIRDHKEHNCRLLAGLWALRKTPGFSMREEYAAFRLNPVDHGFPEDQNFLSARIYPAVHTSLYVTYDRPENLFRGELGDPFPFPWTDALYCGRIETSLEPPVYTPKLSRGRFTISRAR